MKDKPIDRNYFPPSGEVTLPMVIIASLIGAAVAWVMGWGG